MCNNFYYINSLSLFRFNISGSYIISYARDLIISIISLVFNLNRILIAYSSKYFNSLSVVKNYKELIDKLVNFQELFEKIIQIINNLLDKIK